MNRLSPPLQRKLLNSPTRFELSDTDIDTLHTSNQAKIEHQHKWKKNFIDEQDYKEILETREQEDSVEKNKKI